MTEALKLNVVIVIVIEITTTPFEIFPPENLLYFIVLSYLTSVYFYSVDIYAFYHVTITFPAVIEQQDSSTNSSFVFLHLLFIGTFLRVFEIGLLEVLTQHLKGIIRLLNTGQVFQG